MFVQQRHDLILRKLRERGSLRLAELAESLGVSAVTLRRDVGQLAERGLLKRVHGGITLPDAARDPYARVPAAGADRAQDAWRSPVASPTPAIGMLVPSATYYYPNVIRGARERAAELGARLVLGVSRYDEAEERTQVEQLAAGGVEGLLLTLARQPDEGHVDWLAGLGVPTVLVERRAALGGPASLLDAVASHHAHGAYLGVRHLAELGHRRVAMVTRQSPTAPRVRQGFLRAVAGFGLRAGGEFGIDQEGPSDRQVTAVASAVGDGVDGLLVHNDEDALLLVQHLRAAGVGVPGDVSVVAYDDEVAALSEPPLTAVAPPKSAVGRHAVELLLRRIRAGGELPGQHLALLPELRIRASTVARR